ncbi:atypical SDR family protein [Candidatus Nanopelagicus limnes]|uniref:Atypical SDR family protein n=1 Tax=Candidatus Nanopelagicus limnae TaxID=1884634 RepID=A0A249JZ59_9ACTN|nr:atypical SDR family protein [Candidatus Nanopelagicus limnes]
MEAVRRILVTGASGYVGGRLVTALLEDGASVRVFVRDQKKAQSNSWASSVEIATGNASDYQSTLKALTGIHTAYYLLHSINAGTNFDKIESEMATNFAKAAQEAGVKQIIYLGGINNDLKSSKHLNSRANTGRSLASTSVPVMEMRAGIIIGSGSASFEMLRHLTHRLPVMTTPKWVMNKTHPIAVRDVLWYLKSAAKLEKPVSGIFDIGGPEVLTYADMMQKFAKLSGLRKRLIIKVPVLTPNLSSLWIGFVTPVPTTLARPLVGSLISEVVADPAKSIDHLIPKPAEGLIDVSTAITLALSKVSSNSVSTRWSDATAPFAPWQKAQSDPDWAGEALYKDTKVRVTDASMENLWVAIEEIGGDNGWYGADFLWYMRGVMDRMIGGVGLRRGRRDPIHLRVGDSLDFWRVESLIPGESLKLYAEMILPGKAWLEFRIKKLPNGQSEVTQEASYSPRGLGGQLYWYAVLPLHTFVFPTMIRNLIRSANRKDYAARNA